jgi:hypothetical protein
MWKCVRGFFMGLVAIPFLICLIVADVFQDQLDVIDESDWYEQK